MVFVQWTWSSYHWCPSTITGHLPSPAATTHASSSWIGPAEKVIVKGNSTNYIKCLHNNLMPLQTSYLLHWHLDMHLPIHTWTTRPQYSSSSGINAPWLFHYQHTNLHWATKTMSNCNGMNNTMTYHHCSSLWSCTCNQLPTPFLIWAHLCWQNPWAHTYLCVNRGLCSTSLSEEGRKKITNVKLSWEWWMYLPIYSNAFQGSCEQNFGWQ